ncbi:MAG: sodium:solute symporter [Tannerellaceae bacterium]|jgi:Na+/proline symporter|nr:sodium:solute symporter [Tannerellaceae bacterium]
MNSTLILIIILVYFAILLIISHLTAGKKTSANDAFFLGNRKSPWYIVSIAMIGTSLSGVTFVSVPGMVRTIDMTYMQTVLGFFVGYIIIAKILLPLYYKLQLTSIYTCLAPRIGKRGYQTAAIFFLLSKIIGAAARFYLVAIILQTYIFDAWNIPFPITVAASVGLVWLYTNRGGIKTIVWTDMLQCLCFISMLTIITWKIKQTLGIDLPTLAHDIAASPHFHIFEFADWHSTQHFAKQFFSGIFITIVMTGLDQDMMQKNLSCRNLREAQRNMYTYGFLFTPINFLFLTLGAAMLLLAQRNNIPLPAAGDEIMPQLCATGALGQPIVIFFAIGIVAAAFSSADSALTALTTTFCIDLLHIQQRPAKDANRLRRKAHILIAVLFAFIILAFRAANNRSVIDAIYLIASYTYGPLLGLFTFSLFTKFTPKEKYVPCICIASPIICFAISHAVQRLAGYTFSYEMLILNGLLTFVGLRLVSHRHIPPESISG